MMLFDSIYETTKVSQVYLKLTGKSVSSGQKTQCPVCGGNSFQITSNNKAWTCWSGRCHDLHGRDSVGLFSSSRRIDRVSAAKVMNIQMGLSFEQPTFRMIQGQVREGLRNIVPADKSIKSRPFELTSWVTALNAACSQASDRLMARSGEISRRAWDYLTGPERNLTAETIERHKLGLNMEWLNFHDPLPGTNKPCYLPPGIVIPWLSGPLGIVGANTRQFHVALKNKYIMATGSRRYWLYPAWRTLAYEMPLLIVEGEFDALIGEQIFADSVVVKTIGSSTSGPQMLHWSEKLKLSQCRKIMVAADNDKAGEECRKMWLNYSRLAEPISLPCHIKDLSHGKSEGYDMHGWLNSFLETD